jgi:NCAIR mutase (PurE)-related protein
MITAMSMANSINGVSELGFAKVDHARAERCGFPEFIYGAGKTAGQIIAIIESILETPHPALVTRLSAEAAEKVLAKFPEAEYDELSKVLVIRNGLKQKDHGNVLILTAGTSDLPVAGEAKYTVELCGYGVEMISDAGVAGIHRLFAESASLKKAEVIIAIAGMEGALPSVVGGMVSCPVIAVPTSVGYGASLGGFTALFGMLNSCASGITVVNIDNGFGAACAAVRILNNLHSGNKIS